MANAFFALLKMRKKAESEKECDTLQININIEKMFATKLG